jgi:hypothetical protein
MGRAKVQHKPPGYRVLGRRPVLRERVHRRLDAPQAPDVGERAGNGSALDAV